MGFVDFKEILRATNKGLDIISRYYPEAPHALHKNPPKFKIREEKTASAAIRLATPSDVGEEVYVVTDFGGDRKQRHAIYVCMLEDNLSFKEACQYLGHEFGITAVDPKIATVQPTVTSRPATEVEQSMSPVFVYKDKVPDALIKKYFGPLVNEEHFQDFELKLCDHYDIIKGDKVITIAGTDECPIFVYDRGDWRKIYQPANSNKGFKHTYSGTTQPNYVFGLELLEQEYLRRKKERNGKLKDMSDKEKAQPWRPDCHIMSGGTDGLNMYSFGKFPIWFNSESQILNATDYRKIREWCENIYYVADLDKTGIRQAVATGLKYMDIVLVFLPEDIKKHTSRNGKSFKDFKDWTFLECRPGKEDYFKYYLDRVLTSSMPLQFWSSSAPGKYAIRHSQAFQFLRLHGVGRIEDKNLKEGYRFVHVDGSVVRDVDPVYIENLLSRFLENRRMPVLLRDLFLRSGQLTNKQLNKLPFIELDFKTTGIDYQYFFCKNKVIKVCPDKMETSNHGETDIFTWEEKLQDFHYREESPFFKIFHNPDGTLNIKVLRSDCEFFNFLVNASRVHWKKELEDSFSDPLGAQAQAYKEANKFNIEGPNLDEVEIMEQKQHLINKIFSMGYLFHEKKISNQAYCIYAMDHKEGGDGESNGGSGKSLAYQNQYRYLNRKYIPARSNKMTTDNQFIYDGVTPKTDFVLFDDAHKYLKIDTIFSETTGSMAVNPKHGTPFEIPFEDSPKFVITTNYAPEMDRSSARRLLPVVFSDYYHAKLEDDADYLEERKVSDDFGGKNLFESWDDKQNNIYLNFIMQCVQFKLRHPDRVLPPMGNVKVRNLIHSMGTKFYNWANDFFGLDANGENPNLDYEISKKEIFNVFLQETNTKGAFNVTTFKKCVIKYCQLKGWKFNPDVMCTDHDNNRIMRKVDRSNQEFFFIKTVSDEINPVAMSEDVAMNKIFEKQ